MAEAERQLKMRGESGENRTVTGAGQNRTMPSPIPEPGRASGEEEMNTQLCWASVQSEGGDPASVRVNLKSEEGDKAGLQEATV